jgi:carbon storage regulator
MKLSRQGTDKPVARNSRRLRRWYGLPLVHDVKAALSWRCILLVLTRKTGESLIIGDDVVVTVVEIRGDKVRLGVEADPSVRVDREEIRKLRERES